MRRLKIAHLFQAIGVRFEQPGAAQVHIYHTMKGLKEAGHEVSLLALQGKEVLFTDDLGVFKDGYQLEMHQGKVGVSGSAPFQLAESGLRRLQSGLRLPYLGLFDSYRVLDACLSNLSGFDLIHERFNLFAYGGALASRRLGIPLFLEVNADLIAQREYKGVPLRGARRAFAIRATRFVFDAATRILCVSEELRDHLRDHWQVDEDKLAVVPCAADVEAFQPGRDGAGLRGKLGLGGGPVVVWVGGFYKWHDLGLLVRSFRRVNTSMPEAHLLLVGDGDMRPQVERLIEENGLKETVITTGNVPYERIPDYLALADVAVAPSPDLPAKHGGTGAPLKLFEYMAAGKAIVATRSTLSSEIIRQGETGLLVEAGNEDSFGEAICRLLQDPKERRRFGEAARAEAVQHHNWNQVAAELEEIYREGLGEG